MTKARQDKRRAALASALFLGAGLLGFAMSPADAGGATKGGTGFKDCDTNNDGYLSLEEFKAKGLDDLAFRAADSDGDKRVDPGELDRYLKMKAADQPMSAPDAGGQAPAQPAPDAGGQAPAQPAPDAGGQAPAQPAAPPSRPPAY